MGGWGEEKGGVEYLFVNWGRALGFVLKCPESGSMPEWAGWTGKKWKHDGLGLDWEYNGWGAGGMLVRSRNRGRRDCGWGCGRGGYERFGQKFCGVGLSVHVYVGCG